MILEHYPLDTLQHQIRTIVGLYLDLAKYKLFFFGSRVEGDATDRSDIDVGIEGSEPISLQALGAITEGLASLPTTYRIDVVDFGRAEPDFKEVAKNREYF